MTQTASSSPARIGDLIREWRGRRRLSQLDLALEAGISQRHLSFVESGRSAPSREMVETLAETLEVPLRERNVLLLSAGFAPAYGERKLSDPSMQAARTAVELVLKGHEPNPALAVDRLWNMVMSNAAVQPMMSLAADPSLVQGNFNVLRASLHPQGLAPHILNLRGWRDHLLERLDRQIDLTADAQLASLRDELAGYPVPARASDKIAADAIAIPLQLRVGDQVLSFITTITIFGTPVDVTLSELAVEAFFPADAETAAMMQAMARARAN
jgi:transcriptional regulator with XRE-family HTH domain